MVDNQYGKIEIQKLRSTFQNNASNVRVTSIWVVIPHDNRHSY